jgi:SNARE protein
LQANAVHNEIADTTKGIQRDLDETEHIGIGVNSRLLQQREQIERTQGNLDDTEDSLARSKKILSRMGRRVLTDKCIQYLIILIELGIIAMIVWLKWFRK